MCKQGYKDALHFLKKNGKETCLRECWGNTNKKAAQLAYC